MGSSTTAASASRATPEPATAARRGRRASRAASRGRRCASSPAAWRGGGRAWARWCRSPEICNAVDDDCNGKTDDGLSTPMQVVTPRGQNRDADILFMIDDSRIDGAEPGQPDRELPDPDEHDARVSGRAAQPARRGRDLRPRRGAETLYSGCTPGGKGGVFHSTPTGCTGPTGSFIDESNNEATKNYPGTIDEAFACIANVGTTGCGFEHQLASTAVALGFRGTIPASTQASCARTRSSRWPSSPTRTTARRRQTRRCSIDGFLAEQPVGPFRLPLQRVRTPVRRRGAAAQRHHAGQSPPTAIRTRPGSSTRWEPWRASSSR